MMNTHLLFLWRKTPFLRLLMALIAGILLQSCQPCSFSFWCIVILTCLSGVLIWCRMSLPVRFAGRWCQGLLLLVLIAAAGAMLSWHHDFRNRPGWYGQYYQPGMLVAVTLDEPLTDKSSLRKVVARVTALHVNGHWLVADGKLLVYLKKDNAALPLQYGSQLLFRRPLRIIKSSGNPGAFDYAAWCALKHVYQQVYLKQGEYVVRNVLARNPYWQQLYTIRDRILHTLHRYIHDTRAVAVAAALLIGYREELDKELLATYTNTGVVHIIAISGLHLGLIYGLLAVVLRCFYRFAPVRWLAPVVILVVLWLFTFLAGAVPSILRSAVMFSFIITAQASGNRHHVCNNLAGSAFCLLVYDPFFLWDIGFQLSYSAVLGIVLFYRPLYEWPGFRNRLILYAWQLLALSIAAQVFTLPVLLCRFHQFPNLFLVCNFVAVPLSGLILYLEIALLLVAGIPMLAVMTGAGVEILILYLNRFISYMAVFPFSVIENIPFSGLQAGLLYLFIGCCCYAIYFRKRRPGLLILCVLLVMVAVQAENLIGCRLQKRLIVYNIQHTTLVEWVHGQHSYLVAPQPVTGTSQPAISTIWQQLQPAHRLWRVTKTTPLPAQPLMVVNYAGKRVAVLCGDLPETVNEAGVPVDILILGGNAEMAPARLHRLFGCRCVVFDSSLPLWKIEKWKKECDSLHLRFHSVPEQGAFVMEL